MNTFSLNFLQSELNCVSEWIQFSDKKTAFLSAFYSAIFGLVFSQKESILQHFIIYQKGTTCFYAFILLGFIIAFVVGIFFLFESVFPRLKNSFTDKSLFYFSHVANMKFIDYLEEIKNGQDFIKIASEIAKQKPIIILKGGKTPAGNKAAQSHTAAMAGEAKIYSAAFQKAGIIEVETIRDLFLAAQNLGRADLPQIGEAWAILTNGGAVGVITADWCSRLGVKLAEIALQNNPWDVLGDATSEIYQTALLALLKQPDISGVIFCQTLQTMTDPWQNAKIIIKTQKQYPQKPILPLFLGGVKTKKAVDLLKQAGLGCFQEPRDAVMIASLLLTSDVNSR